VVGMTTNGVLLRQHAAALKAAGLTHLNISLDTLNADRFERIALRPRHGEVLAGLQVAQDLAFASLKLNVVVMGGVNDDELADFVRLTQHSQLEVRFIEYMPFTFNRWKKAAFVSCADMRASIAQQLPLVPVAGNDNTSPVARLYRVPGWMGTVGFIASMSDHFCGTCNRVRLTADGAIKSCLFHPSELTLKRALRDNAPDDTIAHMIRTALERKPEGHLPVEELVHLDNETMSHIGG